MKLLPIADAPHDRGILLRMKTDHVVAHENYVVAQYAEWDQHGPYSRVWEIGPGECIPYDDPNILGYYDLPEDNT